MSKPLATGRPGGSARPRVALAVAAVLLVLLPGCGDADAPSAPAAGQASADDHARLDRLQQEFAAAVQHGKPAQPVIDQARALVRDRPDLAAAKVLLTQALMMDDRLAEAYDALSAALQQSAADPELHVLAGSLAMKLRRMDDAERHYGEAVSLDTANGRYRLLLANVQIHTQQFDRARQTLLEALRIDASLHQAHAALSDLFARQNKLGPALDQIDRALGLLPADDTANRVAYTTKQAGLLRRDQRPGDAVAVLAALPARLRATTEVSRQLALSWAAMGRPERAAEHYEQILVIDPTHDRAAAAAAYWRVIAGQLDLARRNLAVARELRPNSDVVARVTQMLRDAESDGRANNGAAPAPTGEPEPAGDAPPTAGIDAGSR